MKVTVIQNFEKYFDNRVWVYKNYQWVYIVPTREDLLSMRSHGHHEVRGEQTTIHIQNLR